MTKKEIKTEIVIQASKEKVWEVLTNFKRYPEWNPFIQSIKGNLEQGEKLKVNIVPPESKGMTFKPTIIVLEENTKLRWLGHVLFKGLFDGLHQFELIENSDGSTTFIQSEIFRGVLLPIFGKKFEANTKAGFELMNNALKNRVIELQLKTEDLTHSFEKQNH